MRYLHAAAFSPVKSTFEKAVKKNSFKTGPGLTPEVLKHLPKITIKVQGHQHQERQNLQSTKRKPSKPTDIEAISASFENLKVTKNLGK